MIKFFVIRHCAALAKLKSIYFSIDQMPFLLTDTYIPSVHPAKCQSAGQLSVITKFVREKAYFSGQNRRPDLRGIVDINSFGGLQAAISKKRVRHDIT